MKQEKELIIDLISFSAAKKRLQNKIWCRPTVELINLKETALAKTGKGGDYAISFHKKFTS